MTPDQWTYARAGVNIDGKSQAIESLVNQLKYRRKGKVRMIDLKGQFTGLIDFGDFALTLCTDGVGTKLLIAKEMNKWDTVGIDCVAMNVNDTICVGAEPIAFVDYLAIPEPDAVLTEQIGIGLEKGAELSDMDIVGGEIAVLPELMKEIDLSGSCLGMVRKERIIDGSKVAAGDVVVGLSSSGIHSNGLTLARKILEAKHISYDQEFEGLGKSIGMELLTPTEIYVRRILALLEKVEVKGMVDITGGGLRNFLRLKKGVAVVIDDPLPPQKIFEVLQELGSVSDREMYQTFNMGMGFALICSPQEGENAASALGEGAKIVGHVEVGEGVSLPSLNLSYTKY